MVARLLERKVGSTLGTNDLFEMARVSALEEEHFNMLIARE
jgi:hypothetical protein